jgi:hypothetical protein
MPKKWYLGNGQNNFVVARRTDLFPPEVNSLPAQTFSENFDQWSAEEHSRLTLLDMWETLVRSSSRRSSGGSVDIGEVRKQLEEMFRGGELVILPVQRREIIPRIKPSQAPLPASDRPPPRTEKKTTWIEIELVTDKGKPVAYERYTIELPDGTLSEGRLDEKGFARVDGIEPGKCLVWFPDIHGKDWQPG